MKITQRPHLHQDWMDRDALEIVQKLQKAGFTTYFVGGCVRDLLLGIVPKDFDIATSARPNDVRKKIKQAYVIGKRFRLVLVNRGAKQFEVATFRRDARDDENSEDLPAGDNIFGTPEEDAQRRDFRLNGLFFDPVNNRLIDYCEGLPDLNEQVIHMIGEPETRLLEDPIRILRALRLAHKIDFSLDPQLREAMQNHSDSLQASPLPRRREEYLKLLRLKDPSMAFLEAFDLNIWSSVAPQIHNVMEDPNKREHFISALRNFHDQSVDLQSPIELFSILMYSLLAVLMKFDPKEPIRIKSILEDADYLSLMKDELGMFNMEQTLFAKAMQLQSILHRRKEYLKRGERRQQAILRNEAFPLALKLAHKGKGLSGEDWNFWTHLYFQSLKKPRRESGKKTLPNKATKETDSISQRSS